MRPTVQAASLIRELSAAFRGSFGEFRLMEPSREAERGR